VTDPLGALCDVFAKGCSGKVFGCLCTIIEALNWIMGWVPAADPGVIAAIKVILGLADCACDILSFAVNAVCTPYVSPDYSPCFHIIGTGFSYFFMVAGCLLDIMSALAGPIFSSFDNTPTGGFGVLIQLFALLFSLSEEGSLEITGVGSGLRACVEFIDHAVRRQDFAEWWRADCP
jgi:hypothetical protein